MKRYAGIQARIPQRFHLLSVDAFSSGSIPIYLLTREALQAYRRHLAPQLKLVAKAEGMKIPLINDDPTEDKYSGTAYVLVTDNPILVADKRFEGADDIEPIPGLRTWTDGFNNLFKVVR